MTIYFTADNHFGHPGIIPRCNRPFASLEEMEAEMIKRWNQRVQPTDIVFHLGDFSTKNPATHADAVNGIIHLIPGNHDDEKKAHRCGRFASISPMREIKIDGIKIVLCHYALRTWNKSLYGSLHLYGHSHGNLPGDAQCLDVGVDCWDFRPVTFEEIKARLATQPPRQAADSELDKARA